MYLKADTAEGEPEKYERIQELIFLIDKPVYKTSNEGNVIRERAIEAFRFSVTDAGFNALLTMLNQLRTAEHKDLT